MQNKCELIDLFFAFNVGTNYFIDINKRLQSHNLMLKIKYTIKLAHLSQATIGS